MAYTYSDKRVNPITGAISSRALDPEIHTIAELDNLPGVYGVQLKDGIVQGTLTVTENVTGGSVFVQVTTAPLAGQVGVTYSGGINKRGLLLFNVADAGTEVVVDYDGIGSVNSIENVQDLIDAAVAASIDAAVAASPATRKPYEVIFTPKRYTLAAATPYFDLRSATQTLSTTNFPDLVPEMRAKTAGVNVSGTDYYSFTVGASYSGTGVTVTLLVANNAQNLALLMAMEEALLYGVTALGCISFAAPVGNIPAGDYAITAVSSSGLSISFTCSVTTGSPSGESFTICPFRIAGSTTTARHHQLTEIGFMVSGGAIVDGYPARDQTQAWQLGADQDLTGTRNYYGTSYTRDSAQVGSASANYTPLFLGTTWQGAATRLKAMSDGTNGTPRTGSKTRGPAFGLNVYYYCGTYSP